MSANTLTLCTGLVIVGLVSACGSGNDTASQINIQDAIEVDGPSSDDTTNINEDPGETNNSETNNGVTDEGATPDVNDDIGDSSTENALANPQNDVGQTDSQQQQTNPEPEGSDPEQPVALPQPVADSQRVSFGTAKLLVDLVPNGDSYPAKFQRVGDKLYFWTVDTDPRFASCAWHWGNLNNDDKKIALNLVAAHPETGVVAMNQKIMTLGDFAQDPNYACAGYNGSIMQVFEQDWITPRSATGEQQFALRFDSFDLGPDQVWMTDGSGSNTSQLEVGGIGERSIFEGDTVFLVNADGLLVSNSISGDTRKLFSADGDGYYGIKLIEKSPPRQVAFEIRVGVNRHQVWTYDLDTDAWVKQLNIKPDNNTYQHYRTLLVDGQTLLSLGQDIIGGKSVLALSSNTSDVTSFDILSDLPNISSAGPLDAHYRPDENGLVYSTTDFTVQPEITSIWSYQEGLIENLFSISEPGLQGLKIIAGHHGRIFVAGTKELRQGSEISLSLELWSYDPQTRQLVKLSDDDWYALISDHAPRDEGYFFRYLNTPDGLIFINLKEDSGRELWFTDGTLENTRQLADIYPGAGDSDPQNFYHSGDAIYFSADDGIHGREPWMIRISR